MQYPIWEVPMLGGGMVIALIAIFHVTIAHFAVGAGIFAAFTHYKALKTNNQVLLRFLKDFTRYLILVSFIAGALSGVGIWFAIALVSPEATSALIHQYVWGWATEFVFFLVEIVAGYIYFYGWDRMEPRKHLQVIVIYAISAYMSLVIINGILTFMLSPGDWLLTQNFWDGFFNPTYWSSLVLRTLSALSLAAIFVTIAANYAKGYTRDERHQIITEGGRWLVPLALMLPVSLWYFSGVPEEARNLLAGKAVPMMLFFIFGMTASTLIGFYAYFGLILKRRYINLETAILLGMIAFIATGSMEFVREGIRKPYVIYGYMYSTGFLKSQEAELSGAGVLNQAPWAAIAVGADSVDQMTPDQRGAALYRAQCLRCHTYDGFNGIQPLIKNWSKETIQYTIKNLHEMKYFMPPFMGPEQDLAALTDHLHRVSQGENVLAALKVARASQEGGN